MTALQPEMAIGGAASAAQTGVPKRVIVYCMNYLPELAGIGHSTGDIAEHFQLVGKDARS